jgi:hypothetical protein
MSGIIIFVQRRQKVPRGKRQFVKIRDDFPGPALNRLSIPAGSYPGDIGEGSVVQRPPDKFQRRVFTLAAYYGIYITA